MEPVRAAYCEKMRCGDGPGSMKTSMTPDSLIQYALVEGRGSLFAIREEIKPRSASRREMSMNVSVGLSQSVPTVVLGECARSSGTPP